MLYKSRALATCLRLPVPLAASYVSVCVNALRSGVAREQKVGLGWQLANGRGLFLPRPQHPDRPYAGCIGEFRFEQDKGAAWQTA